MKPGVARQNYGAMQVLADELSGPVHALSLKTKTPAEVSQ